MEIACAALEKYMRSITCPDCRGTRLNPRARSVRVGGKTLVELGAMPIGRVARAYHRDLTLQDAAAELGLQDAQGLAAVVSGNDRLRQLGLGTLSAGGGMKRDAWSSQNQRLSPFQRAALELDRGSPHLPF